MTATPTILGRDAPPPPHGFVDGVHALRAVAALAIVVYHAGGSIAAPKYQGITGVGLATNGLDVGVDLFFVISGFVIALPWVTGRRLSLGRYLTHRLLRIYPMAMATAAVYLVANVVLFGRDATAGELASSFLLMPNGVDPQPFVLWTLKQELLFYALFAVVLATGMPGLVLLAAWGVASLTVEGTGGIGRWLLSEHNVQFLFGVAACALWHRGRPRPGVAPVLLVAGGAGVLAAGYGADRIAWPAEVWAVLAGLASGAMVLGAAWASPRVPRPILFLGTASFSIYLIHYFFVSVGNKALTAVLPWLPGGGALILLSAFATLGGIGWYLVAERPLEAWRRGRAARTRAVPA